MHATGDRRSILRGIRATNEHLLRFLPTSLPRDRDPQQVVLWCPSLLACRKRKFRPKNASEGRKTKSATCWRIWKSSSFSRRSKWKRRDHRPLERPRERLVRLRTKRQTVLRHRYGRRHRREAGAFHLHRRKRREGWRRTNPCPLVALLDWIETLLNSNAKRLFGNFRFWSKNSFRTRPQSKCTRLRFKNMTMIRTKSIDSRVNSKRYRQN
mmetsp:Transcript_21441/g.53156  ORF Transcript_21441/g.53156 Transcript_21441/m.53156 type:complete len:211 (+) Transcript_21441:492-1124(+)